MIVPFLATMLAVAPAPLVRDYVPDTGWRDDDWARTFYEKWFGRQLIAMVEPPLAAPGDLVGMRQRFRLLVLPTFKPAFAYRVDEPAEGPALLRAARLDGRGGYAPGKLSAEVKRSLRPEELQAFRKAVQAADLGGQPREEPPSPLKTNPDGSQEITICLDGTTYVFERLDQAGRQFIMRMCAIDEEGLAKLVDAVFALNPPPVDWQ